LLVIPHQYPLTILLLQAVQAVAKTTAAVVERVDLELIQILVASKVPH
jgi:hypothetical protein